MSYPFNQTFNTDPTIGGYTKVVGDPAVSWNQAEQSLDILSTTFTHNIVQVDSELSTDFWFEADLQQISGTVEDNPAYPSNSEGRRHFGIWIAAENGGGYLLAHHYYGYERSSVESLVLWYWPNNTSPVSVIELETRQDSWGMFALGERHVFRVEYIGHPTLPNIRLMHFYIDGNLVFQSEDGRAFPTNTRFRPCIFLREGLLRVHQVSGGTPSGLPNFPPLGATYQPLGHDIAYQGHEPTEEVHKIFCNVTLAYGSVDNGGGFPPIGGVFHNLQIIPVNLYYHGTGSIVGTVKLAGTPVNTPLRRRVQLIDQRTSQVVAETWSTEAGDYQFNRLNTSRQWTVMAFDWKNQLRAVVSDNLRAVPA